MFTDDVRTLCTAASDHNRYASRLWVFAATITFLVIATDISNESPQLLGFNIDKQSFYPFSAALLFALNIPFCAGYLQTVRVFRILHDYIKTQETEKTMLTEKFTLADGIHSLYPSTFNRIFPITHFVPSTLRKIGYVTLKIPTDLVYYSFPIIGGSVAVIKSPAGWFTCPLYALGTVSGAATAVALFQAFQWIRESLKKQPLT